MSHNARSIQPTTTARETEHGLEELLGEGRLVLVSNRQPYRHDTDGANRPTVDRPTGGLTAGLDPVMQRAGGTWLAWGDGARDFDVADEDDVVSVPPDDPSYRLQRIRLSEGQVRDYYYGYSNQVLWPICHSALTRVRCSPGYWSSYREVNEQFAGAVADHADGGSLVWFQDYHLALAPTMARQRLPDGTAIAHFWHVPWPSWDTFRACPHAEDLLRGLLGADVLGFHLERYRANFLQCVDAALEGATVNWRSDDVTFEGRKTRIEAIPMGVPVDRIEEQATCQSADSFVSSLSLTHSIDDETRIAVGVDRLDYTKGIVQRLEALERLWERNPGWRGELTYVQNASESRSRIPAYREVQENVVEAVERLNRRFGTQDWRPVVYGTETLDDEELYGLYRRADLALVSPIRDGMNLVAQEYVAAQVDRDGVLVLSDQAGIHDEVGEHAVSISPHDVDGVADGIAHALSMPTGERRRRMARLHEWVAANDLDAWVRRNLESVDALRGPATRPRR